MNTIEKRKEFIEAVMAEFEKVKENNWPYLTGFYARLLANISADRLSDTKYVTQTMQNIMKEME